MAYDVLSEDLFDDSDSPKKRRATKRKNSNEDLDSGDSTFEFNWKYLHFGVIIVFLLFLFFFFFQNINFSFNDEDEIELVTLVGSLKNFNINYSGSVSLYSAEFFLITRQGEFNSERQNIVINNFNGTIYFENKSLIFKGKGDSINFGKNNLNIVGDIFVLKSIKKTSLNIFFDEIIFNFDEGIIKLGSELNHEFKEASISLVEFNSSFVYDGTFSISGVCDSLSMETFKPNLIISYKNS